MTTVGGSAVVGAGAGGVAGDGAGGADAAGGVANMGGSALGGAGAGLGGATAEGGVGSAGEPALERAEVLRWMRLVADYYLADFGTDYDNSWIRATFYDGLMATHRATAEEKYLNAARTWGQANQWQQPTNASIDSNGQPRHADNQNCFQTYAEVYLTEPTPSNSIMLSTAVSVFDSMVASPNHGEWTWCDALFMAPPALVRVAAATSKPAYVALMHDMWWTTHANLYDQGAKLFWRDGNAKQNTPGTFWSRGNGWVLAGIARVLSHLPDGDARRVDYAALLSEMATALAPLQDASDGLWRSDLKNPDRFPNPESSGTALFCYGIAWGINRGVLARATFEPVALKAWSGLVDVALTAEGKVGWVQTVARAPGAANRDDTRDYAAGGFLLAASEMLEL